MKNLFFDFKQFRDDCCFVNDGRYIYAKTPQNALRHFEAWQAALLHSHGEMVKATKREVKKLNPYVDSDGWADKIRVLEARSHRELVQELLRAFSDISQVPGRQWGMYGHDENLFLLSHRLDGPKVVPNEKQYPNSTYKKVWDEVLEYATTNKALVELGLVN